VTGGVPAEPLGTVGLACGATRTAGGEFGSDERHEELARAVVAAVRPIIARETLCEEAAYLRDHRRDDNGAFDLWKMYEAGGPEWLASRAAFHRDNP